MCMQTHVCTATHARLLECYLVLLSFFSWLYFSLYFWFVCLVPSFSTLLGLEALLRYLTAAAWQPLLRNWKLTGFCVWREHFQRVSLSKVADLNTVKSDAHLLKIRGLINMPLLYCPLIGHNLSTHNLPIIMFLQDWSANRTSREHL